MVTKSDSRDRISSPVWDYYYRCRTRFSFLRVLKQANSDEILSLLDLCKGSQIKTALEIGSGEGTFLSSICLKFNAIPYGIDVSEIGMEACKKTLEESHLDSSNLVVQDVFHEGLKNEWANRFDLVTSFGFVEHFDDILKPIQAHADFTRKGGECFFTIPNFGNRYNRTFCWLTKGSKIYSDMTLNERITAKWIAEACSASGLRISKLGTMRSWPMFRPTSLLRAIVSAPMQLLAIVAGLVGVPIPVALGGTYFVIAEKT